MGNFLDIYNKKYLFSVGDIIDGKLIISQKRVKQGSGTSKGYVYRCLKDGYIGECTEVTMKNNKCPVCTNAKVMVGVNDIATTASWMCEYLTDKEDGKRYTDNSSQRTNVRCPNCKDIRSIKIADLKRRGYKCSKCSDGISYPEKFTISVLNQLNIEYTYQLSKSKLKWCDKYKYDFYIPSLNIIVETHGSQHYLNRGFGYKGGRNLKEEQENDKIKKKLALNNEIKIYINLDCRHSELEWIKSNILESKLNGLFDLSKIDWFKCEEFALNSLVKRTCDMYANGLSAGLICESLKISRSTVCKYLKKGTRLKWCDFDGKTNMSKIGIRAGKLRMKTIEMFKEGKSLGIFESATYIEKHSLELFGVKLLQNKVCSVANNKIEQYKGYKFIYI